MRAALLSLFAASALPAQQRDFEWHGPIARGSFIEIRGINGNVRAVPSSSGEVEVVADLEAGEAAPAVQVRVVRNGDGVTVCSVFPGEKQCRPVGESGPGARVDFVVRVPEGVHFSGNTVNGGVEADSLKSNVQASTVNGQVRVSTTGTIRAKTVNGSIHASFLTSSLTSLPTPSLAEAPELSTVNGGIRVVLPPLVKAALHAATRNGRILNDFEARGKVTDQEVIGEIGGGGHRLILNTINGTIELRRGV